MKLRHNTIDAQAGVTLIELMVSITIGMLVVLFLSSLYLSSRTSHRITDDSSRMQEEARAAMHLIGRNLTQAGFGHLVSSDLGSLVNKADLTDMGGAGIGGCDLGFAEPGNLANATCGAGGRSAFEVSYRVEDAGTAADNIGSNADCNGQLAPQVGGIRVATNRFYLNAGNRTLNCVGSGAGGNEQPLIGNVDDFQVRYGMFVPPPNSLKPYDDDGFRSVARYVDAATVGAGNWGDVVSVSVCMELSSPTDNVLTQSQTYRNCNDANVVAADRRLHTVIRGVYTLRNSASVRNTSIR